ncbi:hypothetical protein [Methanosarcina horonobensis]|nr:hypothetical protein [Methanosarcina horonobensis]
MQLIDKYRIKRIFMALTALEHRDKNRKDNKQVISSFLNRKINYKKLENN